jgi:small subunit ribosomal protein S16
MLTIRLSRVGTTKRPFYRVVVMESGAPRDGRFVELLGHYNPRTEPEVVEVDHDRVAYWIGKGARPSDTVRTLLARHPAPPAPAGEPEASDTAASVDPPAGGSGRDEPAVTA